MINFILFFFTGVFLIKKFFRHNFFLKKYLIIYFFFKLTFSFTFFYFGFIDFLGDSFQIFEFGDSSVYHEFGSKLKEFWIFGDLFTVPIEMVYDLEQIGFGYIVGLIYYFFGSNPLNVIGVLNLMVLVVLFFFNRLAVNLYPTNNKIDRGVILLSVSPMLLSVSSVMYKDVFIVVFFLGSVFCINRLFENGLNPLRFFLLILFLFILSTLRISFVWLLGAFMLVKLLWSINEIKFLSFRSIFTFLTIITLFIYSLNNYSNVAISLIDSMQQADGLGGKFMTGSMGSINRSNFIFAIPLKVVYVLLIPFPWLQSQGFFTAYLEQILYILDSIYLITIILLVGQYKNIKVSDRKSYIILVLGVLLQIVFMFFPTRRYLLVLEPILLLMIIPFVPNLFIFFKKFMILFFLMLILNVVLA